MAFVALLLSSAEKAITLTIITDAIAAVPTAVMAWRHPGSQPRMMFFWVAISCGLTILAGGHPERLIDVAYPLYVFLLDAAILAIIVVRQMWLDALARAVASAPLPWD